MRSARLALVLCACAALSRPEADADGWSRRVADEGRGSSTPALQPPRSLRREDPSPAAVEPARSTPPSPAAVREAVERGLRFLAAAQAQQPDGSVPPGGAEKYAPLATTALCALAYMAAGTTPERGPQARELEAALDYLLARVDLAADSPARGYVADPNRDTISGMHGHGFASQALAEAYTMSPRTPRGARIAAALELSLRRTEASQGLEGGWWYGPQRGIEHEGSVTIALVQGLRAAKDAGLRVEPAVIARAVDYVRRSQKEDGSFRYQIGSDRSSLALTAAAITTLNAAGHYSGRELTRAYDFVERELAARELGQGAPLPPVFCPFYERLYLAQALWQNPDRRAFDRWYAATARDLLAAQGPEGGWRSAPYGDAYATAMNVLVLTVPDGFLPMFQR